MEHGSGGRGSPGIDTKHRHQSQSFYAILCKDLNHCLTPSSILKNYFFNVFDVKLPPQRVSTWRRDGLPSPPLTSRSPFCRSATLPPAACQQGKHDSHWELKLYSPTFGRKLSNVSSGVVLISILLFCSKCLNISYKVREPSVLQSEHRKRSTQSDTALLPTNVFFKRTQSPTSESSRRSGRKVTSFHLFPAALTIRSSVELTLTSCGCCCCWHCLAGERHWHDAWPGHWAGSQHEEDHRQNGSETVCWPGEGWTPQEAARSAATRRQETPLTIKHNRNGSKRV